MQLSKAFVSVFLATAVVASPVSDSIPTIQVWKYPPLLPLKANSAANTMILETGKS